MTRQPASLCLALLASVALAPPLAAQNQWQQQVEDQLVEAGAYLLSDGYTLTHIQADRALRDNGTYELWVDLSGGVEYVIVGVCDFDCTDIDLELFSSEGRSIDGDYQLDDVPILTVIPNRSARFRIHVSMATCNVNPCSWGVGVFGR